MVMSEQPVSPPRSAVTRLVASEVLDPSSSPDSVGPCMSPTATDHGEEESPSRKRFVRSDTLRRQIQFNSFDLNSMLSPPRPSQNKSDETTRAPELFRKAVNILIKSSRESRTEEVARQNEILKQELEELKGKEDDLEVAARMGLDLLEENRRLQENVKRLGTQMESYEGYISAKDEEVNELLKDYDDMKMQVTAMQSERARRGSERVSELERENNVLRDRCHSLEHWESVHEGMIKDLEGTVLRLKEQLSTVEKARRESAGSELDRAIQEMDAAYAKERLIMETLKAEKEAHSRTEALLESTQDAVAQGDRTIQALRNEIEGNNNMIKSYRDEISRLRDVMSQMDAEIHSQNDMAALSTKWKSALQKLQARAIADFKLERSLVVSPRITSTTTSASPPSISPNLGPMTPLTPTGNRSIYEELVAASSELQQIEERDPDSDPNQMSPPNVSNEAAVPQTADDPQAKVVLALPPKARFGQKREFTASEWKAKHELYVQETNARLDGLKIAFSSQEKANDLLKNDYSTVYNALRETTSELQRARWEVTRLEGVLLSRDRDLVDKLGDDLNSEYPVRLRKAIDDSAEERQQVYKNLEETAQMLSSQLERALTLGSGLMEQGNADSEISSVRRVLSEANVRVGELFRELRIAKHNHEQDTKLVDLALSQEYAFARSPMRSPQTTTVNSSPEIAINTSSRDGSPYGTLDGTGTSEENYSMMDISPAPASNHSVIGRGFLGTKNPTRDGNDTSITLFDVTPTTLIDSDNDSGLSSSLERSKAVNTTRGSQYSLVYSAEEYDDSREALEYTEGDTTDSNNDYECRTQDCALDEIDRLKNSIEELMIRESDARLKATALEAELSIAHRQINGELDDAAPVQYGTLGSLLLLVGSWFVADLASWY